MPGAYNTPIPNYGQLAKTRIADEVRKDVALAQRNAELTRAQLGQTLQHQRAKAAAEEQIRANKVAEGFRSSQLALQRSQDQRDQAAFDRKKVLSDAKLIDDSAADIYRKHYETTSGKVDQNALRRDLINSIANNATQGVVDPTFSEKVIQGLSHPESFDAYQSKLEGDYLESKAKLTKKGYSSTTAKGKDEWVNPKTKEVKITGTVGGQWGEFRNGTFVPSDPSILTGFESLSTGEAFTKASKRELGKGGAKVDVEAFAGYQDAATTAKIFVNAADIMRSEIENLSDTDFGYTNIPSTVAQKIGQAVNALAGKDIVPVDDDRLAVKTVLDAIKPEQALTFTEKTKGAISDREMRLFLSAIPQLLTSKEGYIFVTNMLDRLGQRAIDAADFVADLRDERGGMVPSNIQAKVRRNFKDDRIFTPDVMRKLRNPGGFREKDGANAVLPKGVPDGSKQIGTSQGKPVYESPDGKRWVLD